MCVPAGLLPLCGLVVLVCWWCCLGRCPLWFGVLVMRCVGVDVCVFLRGVAPLWFGGVGAGGVMPGGDAPLWFGGVGRWLLLLVNIHNYPKISEHVQPAK